eukprot:GEMP01054485.1.p1 GENE.GEMP01054485.1~~GEMP01054485.1.p1  ORF type:complete len:227 (+),score=48.67 GEMP01054485.1:211-891(+)
MIVFFATFGLCVQVNAKILRGQVPLDKETDASLTSSAVDCQQKKNQWKCVEKPGCAWNNEEKKCEPTKTDDVPKNHAPRKKLSDARKNIIIPIAPKMQESNDGIDIGGQTKKGDQASPQETSEILEHKTLKRPKPPGKHRRTPPSKQIKAVKNTQTAEDASDDDKVEIRKKPGTRVDANKRNAVNWEKSAPDSVQVVNKKLPLARSSGRHSPKFLAELNSKLKPHS